MKDPRRVLALLALLTAAAIPLAGCGGGDSGDDQDDGGAVTADTGPTTPEETAADTETPAAPTETDAQRTEDATSAGETGSGESTAGGGEEAGQDALELSSPQDGALMFEPTSLQAPAGSVAITYTNPSAVPHNVALEDQEGEVVTDGGTSEVTADLQAGEYEFFCSVPGHREAGMVGTLTVE